MNNASRSCAFLLLVLISLGQVSLTFSSYFLQDEAVDTQAQLLNSASHDRAIHFSLDLNSACEPNLEDSAEKDLKESIKEHSLESDLPSLHTSLSDLLDTRKLFLELNSHMANRPSVSLYILHHSWKGCLPTITA